MTVHVYDLSVPVFTRQLGALRALLDKAQESADDRLFDSAKFLDTKLAPDMLPFAWQIQNTCDLAKNGAARLAGVERPVFENTEKTLKELQARIDSTLAFLQGIQRASMDDAAGREVTFPTLGEPRTMNGLDYLRYFVLPNFFFHATTAYNLLRQGGVELGKRDFLGGLFGLGADAEQQAGLPAR